MDEADKIGHAIIIPLFIAIMVLLYFTGYKTGQRDAINGKWKYEVNTSVDVKRIRK